MNIEEMEEVLISTLHAYRRTLKILAGFIDPEKKITEYQTIKQIDSLIQTVEDQRLKRFDEMNRMHLVQISPTLSNESTVLISEH